MSKIETVNLLKMLVKKKVVTNLVNDARDSKDRNELLAKVSKRVGYKVNKNTFKRWITTMREADYKIPNLGLLYGTSQRFLDEAAKKVEVKDSGGVDEAALKEHKLRNELESVRRTNKQLMTEVDSLQSVLGIHNKVTSLKGDPIIVGPRKSKTRSPITLVAVASDWHVGEVVKPALVNSLNEYGPAVAETRAKTFFERVQSLTDMVNSEYEVEGLVLATIGDNITGAIHEDIAEENPLGPFGEAELLLNLLQGGLEYLAPKTPKVRVVTVDGNHGRITSKMRVATRNKYSLEAFAYRQLEVRCKAMKNVSWQHATGLLTYLDIYGYTFRFLHGDCIGYGGGIGGVTIPAYKKIAGWDQEHPAHCTVFGHFHQLQFPRQMVINGSLMGYSGFSQMLGASFEPAQQAFFGVHPKIGRCLNTPIVVQ